MRKMYLHWVPVEFTVRFFIGPQRHSDAALQKLQHTVCVQENANEPPKYFKGTCVISRSPVIHPGDGTYTCILAPITVILISPAVQRVYAVGEPPEGKICFFRGLKNVVVLPAVGTCQRVSYVPSLTIRLPGDRSLASCLAGGDLDGYVFTWVGASNAHSAPATRMTSTMIIQV
jgi:RNA-dependent RNA polymerase